GVAGEREYLLNEVGPIGKSGIPVQTQEQRPRGAVLWTFDLSRASQGQQYLPISQFQKPSPFWCIYSLGALRLVVISTVLLRIKKHVRMFLANLDKRILYVVVSEVTQKTFDGLHLLPTESLEGCVEHEPNVIFRLPIHIRTHFQNRGPECSQ